MIWNLVNTISTEYHRLQGTGLILVLFVVAVGIIVALIQGGYDKRSLRYTVLSPFTTIAYVISRTLATVWQNDMVPVRTNQVKDGKRLLKALFALALSVLIVCFIVLNQGERFISSGMYEPVKNTYHMPEGFDSVLDKLLATSDGRISVIPQPGYESYYLAYSSRFDLYYDEPTDEEFLYYSKWQQSAYNELLSNHPYMKNISDAAYHDNVEFVVLKDGDYWSEFPITEFGFTLYDSSCGYNIYRIDREVAKND